MGLILEVELVMFQYINFSINDDNGGLKFRQDTEGNWGYIIPGADTVNPFKTGGVNPIFNTSVTKSGISGTVSASYTSTSKELIVAYGLNGNGSTVGTPSCTFTGSYITIKNTTFSGHKRSRIVVAIVESNCKCTLSCSGTYGTDLVILSFYYNN